MTEIFAVSLLSTEEFAHLQPELMKCVPSLTRERIALFARSNDAQRSLLGEIMARQLLSKATGQPLPDLPFATGVKGKPAPDGFQGIHFNISHSGNWVVVSLSKAVVGVDVEKMRKVPEGVARRFFSAAENQRIEQASDEKEKAEIFFTYWTLKESFLKAIGTGLTKKLSSFTINETSIGSFTLAGDPEAEGFYLHNFSFAEGYKLSACSSDPEFCQEVKILPAKALITP